MPLVYLEDTQEFIVKNSIDGPPVQIKGHLYLASGAKVDPIGGHCTPPSSDREERRIAIVTYLEARLQQGYARVDEIVFAIEHQAKAYKGGDIPVDARYPNWRQDLAKAKQEVEELEQKVLTARKSLRSEARRREREEEDAVQQNQGDAMLIELRKQLAQ